MTKISVMNAIQGELPPILRTDVTLRRFVSRHLVASLASLLLLLNLSEALGQEAPAKTQEESAPAENKVELYQLRPSLPHRDLVLVDTSRFEIRNGQLSFQYPNFKQDVTIHRDLLDKSTYTFNHDGNVSIFIEQDENHTKYLLSEEENIEEKNQNPLHQAKLKGIWKDSQWEISFEDGRQATSEEAKEIKTEQNGINLSHLSYPENSVPVGHSWELNTEETLKIMMPDEITRDAEAQCKFKFEEVIDFNGTLCAKIQFETRLKCKIKDVSEEKKDADSWMDHHYELKGVIFRALDQPRDLFYQLRGKIDQTMPSENELGEQGFMILKGPIFLSGSEELKPLP